MNSNKPTIQNEDQVKKIALIWIETTDFLVTLVERKNQEYSTVCSSGNADLYHVHIYVLLEREREREKCSGVDWFCIIFVFYILLFTFLFCYSHYSQQG